MRKPIFIILFLLSTLNIFATHIVGGEVAYTYLGPGAQPNSSRYRVLVRLFTECGQACGTPNNTTACPPASVVLGIFVNTAPYTRVVNLTVPATVNPQINLSTYPPCLDNPPTVCYQVNTYTTEVELNNNAEGYRFAFQSCCRASTVNVSGGAPTQNGVPGATYEAVLPGTSLLPTGHNSTAIVNLKDTALICHNSAFTLEFSAIDPDPQDSLSYHFVSAYNGGSFPSVLNSNSNYDPDNPLYGVVSYAGAYSGTSPLGASVTIDPRTGIISGIAPSLIGRYVVNVLVREWRGGILIAEHRKDFIVQTNDCTITKAVLSIIPVTCDGFTVDFSPFNSSSGNINTYQWIFGDPASGSADTSTLSGPSHTFTSAGSFTVRLKISSSGTCIDSTSQTIKVFPGFFPDFTVAGQCKNTPIQFNDITTAAFGTVNKWQWNFGDTGSPNNTSTIKSPTHTYATSNSYDVTFIVSTSVGCIDTVLKTIQITDQPTLSVLPKDTLICIVDTLQLNAIGTGTFVWTPNYNINSVTSATPLVSPDVTTLYRVTLTDPFGCVGNDSVRVRVVNQVTQFAPADTTICKTDGVVLKLVSDAVNFLWTETPAGNTLNNTKIKNPVATPVTNTTYHVVGSIGKCIAQNDILVKPVPYPDADAGADQTICLGGSAQLNATGGSIYSWTPAAFLNNRLIPNPISINPPANIKYVVTVTDILGCPKPVKDTVIVTVAVIKADAGPSDTSVILGQPLLLQATGSTNYLWSPAQWLTNIGVSNPVSLPQDDIKYFVKVYNDQGCFDIDSIRVHLFKLESGIYVPSAFTPNGDGNNDYLHPIIIGMKSLDVFMVYNRWGQLLYRGTDAQKGWDGTFVGKGQDPATYVWYAEGTTYKNVKIRKKGYAVLIR